MLNIKYLDQTDCIILHNLFFSIHSMRHFLFLFLIVSVDPVIGSLLQLRIVLWNRASKHRGTPSAEQMPSGWHSGRAAYAFFLILLALRKAFMHPAMYFPSVSSPLLISSLSPIFILYVLPHMTCLYLVFCFFFFPRATFWGFTGTLFKN